MGSALNTSSMSLTLRVPAGSSITGLTCHRPTRMSLSALLKRIDCLETGLDLFICEDHVWIPWMNPLFKT
ncbi:hypothetical protein CEXT_543701 [Caerostris extrusa]|uniref:Uncharacterized protein n=1 Tax=Caerostris extrusa TaxID=172846 RepID=A0AAV4N5W1_CAEEX|nr:hypothetical protein CEXT_543701 [Caerostris extrusa]